VENYFDTPDATEAVLLMRLHSLRLLPHTQSQRAPLVARDSSLTARTDGSAHRGQDRWRHRRHAPRGDRGECKLQHLPSPCPTAIATLVYADNSNSCDSGAEA
jgi:hypothetical protein